MVVGFYVFTGCVNQLDNSHFLIRTCPEQSIILQVAVVGFFAWISSYLSHILS